ALAEETTGTVLITISGTLHAGGRIEANQVWQASEGPHDVAGVVMVGGPACPVLTIEPGTQIRMAGAAGFRVGVDGCGGLRAEGTSGCRVMVTRSLEEPEPGAWRGIIYGPQTVTGSALLNTTLRYCGAFSGIEDYRGCVIVYGDNANSPSVLVEDVL